MKIITMSLPGFSTVPVAIVPEHFINFNEFICTKPLWGEGVVLFHFADDELRHRELKIKTPSPPICQIWGDEVWIFGVLLYIFKIALHYLYTRPIKSVTQRIRSEQIVQTEDLNKSLAQYIWQWHKSSFPDHFSIVWTWDHLSLPEILAQATTFYSKEA